MHTYIYIYICIHISIYISTYAYAIRLHGAFGPVALRHPGHQIPRCEAHGGPHAGAMRRLRAELAAGPGLLKAGGRGPRPRLNEPEVP